MDLTVCSDYGGIQILKTIHILTGVFIDDNDLDTMNNVCILCE